MDWFSEVTRLFPSQMVDKIWYDWQHANPANFWSFDGGAVAVLNNSAPVPAFPNGGPPYVTVSSLSTSSRSLNHQTLSQFATPIPTDGILNNYTIYELMDTRNERLCYIYE